MTFSLYSSWVKLLDKPDSGKLIVPESGNTRTANANCPSESSSGKVIEN